MQKFIFNLSVRLLSRDISNTFETYFFGPVRDKISDFFNSKRSSDDCKTLLPDVAALLVCGIRFKENSSAHL